jgi:hypothetical protein
MSTRKTPGGEGGRCVRVTTLPPSWCRMSRRSRSLNLLEPQEPHQACSGKPLPLPFGISLHWILQYDFNGSTYVLYHFHMFLCAQFNYDFDVFITCSMIASFSPLIWSELMCVCYYFYVFVPFLSICVKFTFICICLVLCSLSVGRYSRVGITYTLYYGDPRLKSTPRDRLTWLRYFMAPRSLPELKLGDNHFLLRPLQCIIHYNPIIQPRMSAQPLRRRYKNHVG